MDFTIRRASLMEGIPVFHAISRWFRKKKEIINLTGREAREVWMFFPGWDSTMVFGNLGPILLLKMKVMKDSCTTFFFRPPPKKKTQNDSLRETYMILGPSLEIWTLHTRHLSVSSSNLLGRWPFTSTVGQKYCLKNSLHQIGLFYVVLMLKFFSSMENFLKHEEYTPEQLTWHGMNKNGGLGRCFPFPLHGPFLQVPPLVFGSVSAKNWDSLLPPSRVFYSYSPSSFDTCQI